VCLVKYLSIAALGVTQSNYQSVVCHVDVPMVDVICDIIELTQIMPQYFNSVLMNNEARHLI